MDWIVVQTENAVQMMAVMIVLRMSQISFFLKMNGIDLLYRVGINAILNEDMHMSDTLRGRV